MLARGGEMLAPVVRLRLPLEGLVAGAVDVEAELRIVDLMKAAAAQTDSRPDVNELLAEC